jgi:DNA-binding GntR family transcriptional regulator
MANEHADQTKLNSTYEEKVTEALSELHAILMESADNPMLCQILRQHIAVYVFMESLTLYLEKELQSQPIFYRCPTLKRWS